MEGRYKVTREREDRPCGRSLSAWGPPTGEPHAVVSSRLILVGEHTSRSATSSCIETIGLRILRTLKLTP
jgi:hypothetical protein